jgi:RNA polymerase sigma-70 factor (ECF subfamily)
MTDDFAQFFASTCPGMLAKAILLSGHRQEAEDAVQEAYTEALRAWHRIGGYDSPEAWVYKVMSQRLWAASRRASRQTPSGLDLKVPAPAQAGPERTAEARAVIAALAALPGKMRFVMVMHCLNGMSQEEVARELGLARGTVAVYLHSARRLLERTLDMTPARHADQPLVRVAVPSAPVQEPDPAAGPLAHSLRAAETWLCDGLADAGDTMSALGAAVAAGAREQRPGIWRRWRQRARALMAAP